MAGNDDVYIKIEGDASGAADAADEASKAMDGLDDSVEAMRKQFATAGKQITEMFHGVQRAAQDAAAKINETQFKASPYSPKDLKKAQAEMTAALDARKLVDYGSAKDITAQIAPITDATRKQFAAVNEEIKKAAAKAAADARAVMVKELSGVADDVGKRLESGFGTMFKTIAAGVTVVSGAIAAFAKSSLDVGGNFEKQMNRVQIISGATGEQLEAMTQKAREMGAALPIMASDAAAAMELLAQRGTQFADIMTQVVDVSNLAISQNATLADSASLLGSTLTTFGLAASEASKVVDMFNNASNQSALNMQAMANSLAYVGPAAAAAGYKLEEALAALEALANAGLDGSMSGTGLAMTISKLASVSEVYGVATKNLEGQLRPLSEIFTDLQQRGITLAEATSFFGERAAKSALTLTKYGSILKNNEKNLQQWGATQRAVDLQLETFNNKMNALASIFESIQITVFDQIKDAAKGAVGGITELLTATDDWLKSTNAAGKLLQGFMKGLGLNIPGGEDFRKFLDSLDVGALVERTQQIGTTLREIGESFVALFNVIKGPIAFIMTNLETFAKISFWGWITGKAMQVPKTILDLAGAFGKLATSLKGEQVAAGLQSIGEALGKTAFSINSLKDIPGLLANMVSSLGSLAASGIKGALSGVKNFITGLATLTTTAQGTTVALSAMGTVLAGGLGIGAAIKGATAYSTAMANARQKTEEAVAGMERASQKEFAGKFATTLKTGFEDISVTLQGLDKDVQDWLKNAQALKQDKFYTALQKFNDELLANQQNLKISEDEVKIWGGAFNDILQGSDQYLANMSEGLRTFLLQYRAAMQGAKTGVEDLGKSTKNTADQVREQLKADREAEKLARKKRKTSFATDVSTDIKNWAAEVPQTIKEIQELLGKSHPEMVLEISIEKTKAKIDEAAKELAEKFQIPEGSVMLGFYDALEKAGKSGDKFSAALAASLGVAEKQMSDFADKARDAVENLKVDPSKFVPALQGMLAGMNKIDAATGKANAAFVEGRKLLKEWADMSFNQLSDRIEKLKKAAEGGFIDRKALDAEFENAFKQVALKLNMEFKETGLDKQLDTKNLTGVLASEISSALQGMFGDTKDAEIAKKLDTLIKATGGDLAKAIDHMAETTAKDAEWQRKNAEAMAARQRGELPGSQAQQQNAGLVSQIKQVLDQTKKTEATMPGTAADAQSRVAGAAERLLTVLTPLAVNLTTMAQSMTGNTTALTENTTAARAMADAVTRLIAAQQAAQQTNQQQTGTEQQPVQNITNNITINQRDFRVASESDADRAAKAAADALSAGIGNASS